MPCGPSPLPRDGGANWVVWPSAEAERTVWPPTVAPANESLMAWSLATRVTGGAAMVAWIYQVRSQNFLMRAGIRIGATVGGRGAGAQRRVVTSSDDL